MWMSALTGIMAAGVVLGGVLLWRFPLWRNSQNQAVALTTCALRNQAEGKYKMNIKICNPGCP